MFDKFYFDTLNDPKDIFKYVCDSVGEYYKEKGFKYIKSKRSILWETERLSHCIVFGTASFNKWGETVIFSVSSAVFGKDKGEKLALRFPMYRFKAKKGQTERAVIYFDGAVVYDDFLWKNERPHIVWQNSCNLQGLDDEGFENILKYLDKLIDLQNSLETKEGVEEYLDMISESTLDYVLEDEKTREYIEKVKGRI